MPIQTWARTSALGGYVTGHGGYVTGYHLPIKYTPKQSFKKFADTVSDARSAGDVDKAYDLIAETVKFFHGSKTSHRINIAVDDCKTQRIER